MLSICIIPSQYKGSQTATCFVPKNTTLRKYYVTHCDFYDHVKGTPWLRVFHIIFQLPFNPCILNIKVVSENSSSGVKMPVPEAHNLVTPSA